MFVLTNIIWLTTIVSAKTKRFWQQQVFSAENFYLLRLYTTPTDYSTQSSGKLSLFLIWWLYIATISAWYYAVQKHRTSRPTYRPSPILQQGTYHICSNHVHHSSGTQHPLLRQCTYTNYLMLIYRQHSSWRYYKVQKYRTLGPTCRLSPYLQQGTHPMCCSSHVHYSPGT